MPSRTDVLFVVVLYNQVFGNTNIYRSLLKSISAHNIFVWDNSVSSNLNYDLNSHELQYIYSQRNEGVSYPYNRAFDYASRKGFRWMMLLDQDTIFADTFLEILESAMLQYPEIKMFCPLHQLSNGLYLSPVRFFMKFTNLSNKRVSGVINVSEFAIINSGLVIDVATFKKAGGYNEKAFLDYSDFQFLERFAKVESKAFCLNSICIQDFSDNCTDKEKLLNRFSLFCQSLKGCEHKNIWSAIEYDLIVLKRCISLISRLKNIQPVSILYNNYIK